MWLQFQYNTKIVLVIDFYGGIFLEILWNVTVVRYCATLFFPVATDLIFVPLIAVCVDPVLVTESIHPNQTGVPIYIHFEISNFPLKNEKHLPAALYHTTCFSFSSMKNLCSCNLLQGKKNSLCFRELHNYRFFSTLKYIFYWALI